MTTDRTTPEPTEDAYRVRVYPGAPARSLRHPFRLRWSWGVQIDHISQWDEHGDAEQLDGFHWFDSQKDAELWGVGEVRRILRHGGCDQCASLGIPATGPLVVYVGPTAVVDERVTV